MGTRLACPLSGAADLRRRGWGTDPRVFRCVNPGESAVVEHFFGPGHGDVGKHCFVAPDGFTFASHLVELWFAEVARDPHPRPFPTLRAVGS
jgi:hypothetical protein